jgi:hypothetical protein
MGQAWGEDNPTGREVSWEMRAWEWGTEEGSGQFLKESYLDDRATLAGTERVSPYRGGGDLIIFFDFGQSQGAC